MPTSAPSPSSQLGPLGSLLNAVGAVFKFIGMVVRKMPMVVVFVVIAAILYYHQSHQPGDIQSPQFHDPAEKPGEPKPPPDLPAGTNPSLWTLVYRVDSQLSNGLWADIYYGMEARLDGKVVTVKVTDIYFLRTKQVLEARGLDKQVRVEVGAKGLPEGYEWAVLAGLEDVLRLLEGRPVTVEGLPEGSLFKAYQPVLSIEGRYLDFG